MLLANSSALPYATNYVTRASIEAMKLYQPMLHNSV